MDGRNDFVKRKCAQVHSKDKGNRWDKCCNSVLSRQNEFNNLRNMLVAPGNKTKGSDLSGVICSNTKDSALLGNQLLAPRANGHKDMIDEEVKEAESILAWTCNTCIVQKVLC